MRALALPDPVIAQESDHLHDLTSPGPIKSTTNSAPVKVLYICGYGRSGSTLFDILLSNHLSMFGAGEIGALTKHVWSKDEYCACGYAVSQCSFWRPVVDHWGEHPATYSGLQQRAEMTFAPFGRRSPEYARKTAALMRLLSAASGRPVIVDSSKLPGRGFALAACAEIDLYVVHLVRDGRGVAWSLMKPYKKNAAQGLQKEIIPKSVVYTALRWVFVNVVSELLCRRVGSRKTIRVRYEDLIRNPNIALARVADMVGLHFNETVGSEEFHPRHQVAGNRLRLQRSITLVPDVAWRDQLPVGKRRLLTVLCGPMLRRYGYL